MMTELYYMKYNLSKNNFPNHINIHADTWCTYLFIRQVIDSLPFDIKIDELVEIFVFEGLWLTPMDFMKIKKSASNKVLVIAREVTIHFLRAHINSYQYTYVPLDTNTVLLKRFLHSFVIGKVEIARNPIEVEGLLVRKALDFVERRVIELITRGASLGKISTLTGMSEKRVSNKKLRAMRKLGLTSTAGLVYQWQIIKNF